MRRLAALPRLRAHRSPAALACLLAFLSLVAAPASWAETLIVTQLGDSGPGSLREAIETASDGDAIEFAVTGTIGLESQLFVDVDLDILGPGAELLSLSGQGASRVLEVAPGVVASISGVTIRDGYPARAPSDPVAALES